ncbi:tRNA pseudouridine synthase 3 [Cichlidogyrus casuarinus]|uniref:tRNA pseudouridine synthase n=1 Tax=Cichlidogyrus casuarinus TaxID=1844966 RepID=A0ABD2QD64_9PLAT
MLESPFADELIKGSNLISGKGILEDSGENVGERSNIPVEEIDYAFILNKILPRDIRVLGWSPVAQEFDARHSCKGRAYRYFFPRDTLDFLALKQASNYFVGTHDFRNLSSSQVKNGVFECVRDIKSIEIETPKGDIVSSFGDSEPHEIFCLHIKAPSFLYHQIRCMVAFIMIVGAGLEPPEASSLSFFSIMQLIQDLLDINKYPSRPQYKMASDFPLVFCDTEFNDLEWKISKDALEGLIRSYHRYTTELGIKHETVRNFLAAVNTEYNITYPSIKLGSYYLEHIVEETKCKNGKSFKKIFNRPVGPTIETQIDKLGGREAIINKIRFNSDKEISEPLQKRLRTDPS